MTFVRNAGVSKSDNLVDIRMLEACIRDELNETAPRRVCVVNPVKVVIDNLPKDFEENFELPNHPQHPEMGTRSVCFTKELYIDARIFQRFLRQILPHETERRGAADGRLYRQMQRSGAQ